MLNNKNSLYLLLSPDERCSSFSTISKIPTDIWDSLRSTPSLRRLCKRALPASHSQHCFSPFNCPASPLYSGWLTWYFSFSCGAGGSLFLCTNRTIMKKKKCLSSHCLVLLFGPLWYPHIFCSIEFHPHSGARKPRIDVCPPPNQWNRYF